MAMSVKVFDGLTNSDFQNGAVRDEIKHSLKELERINEYFAQQAVEADAYRFLKDQNTDLNKVCIIQKTALKQCIKVLREWHGHDAFEIYYDHSPEMRLVRNVLPGFRVAANQSIQRTAKISRR